MKRTLSIILAAAAVLACTKTEVNYDMAQQSEIAIMPASSGITKAAITDGVFPKTNHIGLYAFYTNTVEADQNGKDVADYAAFNKNFFNNVEFYCPDQTKNIWAGLTPQYWPATGSMVFAGYSLDRPAGNNNTASTPNGTPGYTLSTDCFTLTDYVQSNETDKTYDLLYFGRTNKSYGKNSVNVPVVFHHALAWIKLEVCGTTGALVPGREWAITNVEFRGVSTKGDFTYTGTSTQQNKASWNGWESEKNLIVFNEDKTIDPVRNRQTLTSGFEEIENVEDGTLVIPQSAKKLYVTIEYLSPASDVITEVVEIDIPAQTPTWEAGKKYTYQLTFRPQEILVAPSVGTWD